MRVSQSVATPGTGAFPARAVRCNEVFKNYETGERTWRTWRKIGKTWVKYKAYVAGCCKALA